MCVAGVGCKKAIVENRALLGAVVVKADTGHATDTTLIEAPESVE